MTESHGGNSKSTVTPLGVPDAVDLKPPESGVRHHFGQLSFVTKAKRFAHNLHSIVDPALLASSAARADGLWRKCRSLDTRLDMTPTRT